MPAYNWGSLHLNDSCLDVKVIIWNDFIYGYTFLGLICIHRKMPAKRKYAKKIQSIAPNKTTETQNTTS